MGRGGGGVVREGGRRGKGSEREKDGVGDLGGGEMGEDVEVGRVGVGEVGKVEWEK